MKALLEREFGGKAVSKQNLCQWRARGFAEWQGEGRRGLRIENGGSQGGAGAVKVGQSGEINPKSESPKSERLTARKAAQKPRMRMMMSMRRMRGHGRRQSRWVKVSQTI
jgi:hypothetical protein